MATIQTPSPGTDRERANRDQLQLITPLQSRYDLVITAGTAFSVVAPRTWKGSETLVLPFHEWLPTYDAGSPVARQCAEGDISTGVTGVGGVIDGSGAVTAGQYLIWGLMSAVGGAFLGYGITRRPDYAGTLTAGGGLGVASTVTMAVAGRGNCYTVGARVIVRDGTALGALYNQGTVTAVTSTTVAITLDALYAAIPAPTVNAAIPVATAVSVIQLDRYAPWVSGTDQGTFGNAPFALLGSVETDGARIPFVRKVGEPVWFATPISVYLATTAAATAVICLRRWIGRHVRLVSLEGDIILAGGAGGINTRLRIDAGALYGRFSTCSTSPGVRGACAADVNPGPLATTARAVVTVDGGSTVTTEVSLRGWTEEVF